MKIEIKNRYTKDVLFDCEQDDNSIKITLQAAVQAGADLRGACLRGPKLRGACIRYAGLRGADLRDAKLDGADLSGADLRGVKNVSSSHYVLAHIAISYDKSLAPVAAMIAGRLVGCWSEYTECIMAVFGEDTISKLTEAWLQDESWGVRERLVEHRWINASEEE